MNHIELEIGNAAGKIWNVLSAKGSMSRSQIAKEAGLSTQLLNQGIGWLAREGKLVREKTKRGKRIKLTE